MPLQRQLSERLFLEHACPILLSMPGRFSIRRPLHTLQYVGVLVCIEGVCTSRSQPAVRQVWSVGLMRPISGAPPPTNALPL